jgi:hypothetical protein|tara:strand:- start:56 stop:430 length:375 start_codon:yes stop_codon:yes gene_type:complete
MNLIRFTLVTSDEFVANSAIILDASRIVESVCTGATCVTTFEAGSANSILTATFDGDDGAEKLLNATKFQNELMKIVTLAANHNQKNALDFFPAGETIDAFGTRLGIVHTSGGAGEGLISIALT